MISKLSSPWYILGAGAIGKMWASYLTLSGFEVTLICRKEKLAGTFTLVTKEVEHSIKLSSITVQELTSKSDVIDNLLVTTKAHHTLLALKSIRPSIAADATVVVLQNGMAAFDVPTVLSTQDIVHGVTSDGVFCPDRNRIVHAGKGITAFGSIKNHQQTKLLLEQFPTQFLTIEFCDDIALRQWKKLAINCAINGLTAIYNCNNGTLLDIPDALARMRAICSEFCAVVNNLDFPPQAFTDIYHDAIQTLELTANNFSSMYQDIARGRETEIDYLNGYLLRKAESLAMHCPANEQLVEEVKQLARPRTP